MDYVLAASMAIAGAASYILAGASGRSGFFLNLFAWCIAIPWLSAFSIFKLSDATRVNVYEWTGAGELDPPTVFFMAIGAAIWLLGERKSARGT